MFFGSSEVGTVPLDDVVLKCLFSFVAQNLSVMCILGAYSVDCLSPSARGCAPRVSMPTERILSVKITELPTTKFSQ